MSVIINLATKSVSPLSPIASRYIDAFSNIYNLYGSKTYIYFNHSIDHFDRGLTELWEKSWIYVFSYHDLDDILAKLISLDEKILLINTFEEWLVDSAIVISKKLWLKVTNYLSVFRDKKQQRSLLLAWCPDYSIKFLEYNSIHNVSIDDIESSIWYPFIVKPTSAAKSSLVYKISDRHDFDKTYKQVLSDYDWFTHDSFSVSRVVVEEFVDGEMYSIDYFVNNEGKVFVSKPVRIVLGYDLGIPDFMNIVRFSGPTIESLLVDYDLYDFISSSVDAIGIRNQFVHHEFKVTSSGLLKTIEVNGRIWWYRLAMMKKSYDFNLFSFVFWKQMIWSSWLHTAVVEIYPFKTMILQWFNTTLFDDISSLTSHNYTSLKQRFVWKKVGHTRHWYGELWYMIFVHSDFSQLKADVDFVLHHYRELVF